APDEPRTHVVRPGETLRAISTRYLGSAQRWQEIHRLNPGIADPDKLQPGQRVQVPAPLRNAPAAQVRRVSRRVEARPSPIPWEAAHEGDLLVERDGVRTYSKSSADMTFTDGTRLTVTEDSLVFLQRTGGTLRGVPDRKSIEIVDGQADIEARPEQARANPEIEIVLGKARATSRPSPGGTSQTRARRAEAGGAKLMVYGGASEVEAGGAKVAVPEGMGTSVTQNGPPSPPEKLLPAVRLSAPEAGAGLECSNPALAWEPVEGAESYTVEVCRDPGCGALVERVVGYGTTEWRAAALPLGELFWRVTARSSSGLDGYPSEAAPLSILADRSDLQPPAGALEVAGRHITVGDRLFVNADAELKVSAEDAQTGVSTAVPPALPQTAGEHTVTAVVSDRCGNRTRTAPVVFTVDTEAPTIRWVAGDAAAFAQRGEPQGWERDFKRRRTLIRQTTEPSPLAWSSGGLGWIPAHAGQQLRVDSDRPQIFLRGEGTSLRAGDEEIDFSGGHILWIEATDEGAGVEHLTLQVQNGVLQLEAADLVGNVRRMEWPVSGL
ncbi:MAG TPA: LysM peptidoglycan-binding domain-containing protein, partial [Thermoanaerobaculia bacterium]|nr:LysM peptidoglycan-binding domain-containing protein [Thermoanaerobaculia bacterium]